MAVDTIITKQKAGFFKRIAALVYDTLIIAALLVLASAIAMIVVTAFLGSEAITEQQILIENPLFFSWLLFCWFYYYYWCWQKAGQTLGMKTWKIKLITEDGKQMSLKNALIRFASGMFGLANVWLCLPGKRGWHDILSHSDIIRIKSKSDPET